MNILALDMATVTGWATNIHGRRSGINDRELLKLINVQMSCI